LKKRSVLLTCFVAVIVLYLIIVYCSNGISVFDPEMSATTVLASTLIALIYYVSYTRTIAIANENLIRESKTPLISCAIRSSSKSPFDIVVEMQNHKPVKTKVTLKIELTYNGDPIGIYGDFYNGNKEWILQPLAYFRGHHDLRNDIDKTTLELQKLLSQNKNNKDPNMMYFIANIGYLSSEGFAGDSFRLVYYFDFADGRFYPHPEESFP